MCRYIVCEGILCVKVYCVCVCMCVCVARACVRVP